MRLNIDGPHVISILAFLSTSNATFISLMETPICSSAPLQSFQLSNQQPLLINSCRMDICH